MTQLSVERLILVIICFLLFEIPLNVIAEKFNRPDSSIMKRRTPDYQRVANSCFINDYSAWLKRQQEFILWLTVSKILRLSSLKEKEIQKEIRKYRLQHQCLRIMERLPVSVGPG